VSSRSGEACSELLYPVTLLCSIEDSFLVFAVVDIQTEWLRPVRQRQVVIKHDVDCCPQCGLRVYFAEEILALKRKWHRLCFKCGTSFTTLLCGKYGVTAARDSSSTSVQSTLTVLVN